MASSPSIREFSRVDDAAIFIDDSFDAETVRSIAGTSPSAVVMLSPQRMPVDANGYSPAKPLNVERSLLDAQPTSYVSGLSDSARKRPNTTYGSTRLFGTDLSNVGGGGGSASKAPNPSAVSGTSSGGIRPFGSRLCFSACTTPKDPRKSNAVTRPTIFGGRRASSAGEAVTGTSPHCANGGTPSSSSSASQQQQQQESLADILRRHVPLEDYERLEKERNRFREMYRYQAQLCEELTKREAEAQSALQEKIIEVIAVSSRNEESKRFIRQMKREMQECRERALPFLNRKLDEVRVEKALKEKYETMMATQEAIFESEKAEMEKEMGALEALLKDSKCAAGMGKNSDSLLRASYLKNTRMFNDLYHTRRERDAEMERRIELERQIEGLKRDRREVELTLTKERRAHCLREEQLIEDVHVMHEEVMALTNELLEVQLRAQEEAAAAAEEGEEEYQAAEGEDGDDRDCGQPMLYAGGHPPEEEDEEEDFRPTVIEEEYVPTSTVHEDPTATPTIMRPARRPLAVPQQ